MCAWFDPLGYGQKHAHAAKTDELTDFFEKKKNNNNDTNNMFENTIFIYPSTGKIEIPFYKGGN